MKIVHVGKVAIGADELVLIAGPCVIESEQMCLKTAGRIKSITEKLGVPFVFKSSYDKANRTHIESFRGPGLDAGLKILKKVRTEFEIPVLSDVHCREEVDSACNVLDVLQIPAYLCRQTDLIVAAAKTGKALNIKKGQFVAPWDMKNILGKAESSGNKNIIVTERGTVFGYNNLVVDMRVFAELRKFGYPVIFDGTHSVQLPGGQGTSSGGQREYVPALSRAAVAAGCDGLFLEVHPDPDEALCDGPNMLPISRLQELLQQVLAIRTAVDW